MRFSCKEISKTTYQGSQFLGLNDITQGDIDGIFNEMSYLARLLPGLGGVT